MNLRGPLEKGSWVYMEAHRVVGGDGGPVGEEPDPRCWGQQWRHARRPLLQLKNCNEDHLGVNKSAINHAKL